MNKCFNNGSPGQESGELNIFSLPLKTQYKLLVFHGTANGAGLTPAFNLGDIYGHIFILKSFRIIPYASEDTIDFFVTDSVTTNSETIQAGNRLDRIFDDFLNGTSINFRINNNPIPIFAQIGTNNFFPLDLWIDNIFHKVPEKLAQMSLSIESQVTHNLINDAKSHPYVKVLIECYIQ